MTPDKPKSDNSPKSELLGCLLDGARFLTAGKPKSDNSRIAKP